MHQQLLLAPVDQVLNSYNYSQFQSLLQKMDQSQKIGFADQIYICNNNTPIDPNCGAQICQGAVTQSMVLSMISSQIATTMGKTIQQIVQGNTSAIAADNTTKATSSGFISDIGGVFGSIASAIGLTIFGPFIVIFLLIIVIVVGMVLYRKFSGTPASTADVTAAAVADPYGPPDQYGLPMPGMPTEFSPTGVNTDNFMPDRQAYNDAATLAATMPAASAPTFVDTDKSASDKAAEDKAMADKAEDDKKAAKALADAKQEADAKKASEKEVKSVIPIPPPPPPPSNSAAKKDAKAINTPPMSRANADASAPPAHL